MPKKPNMADGQFEDPTGGATAILEEDKEEPSLLEIKKLLIGIQTSRKIKL